tara:strand:+ start:70 stop:186 length:117 start_codon:yes stop_codon:yes gene_type:complete
VVVLVQVLEQVEVEVEDLLVLLLSLVWFEIHHEVMEIR